MALFCDPLGEQEFALLPALSNFRTIPFVSTGVPVGKLHGHALVPPGPTHCNNIFEQVPNDTFANMTAQGTVVAEKWEPRTQPPVPPTTPGDKAEVFRYMKEQLDCFGKQHNLLGRYHIMGPTERRAGGVRNTLSP